MENSEREKQSKQNRIPLAEYLSAEEVSDPSGIPGSQADLQIVKNIVFARTSNIFVGKH